MMRRRNTPRENRNTEIDAMDIAQLKRRKIALEVEKKQIEIERLRDELVSRAKLREIYERIKKDLDTAINMLAPHAEKHAAVQNAIMRIDDAQKRMRLWMLRDHE